MSFTAERSQGRQPSAAPAVAVCDEIAGAWRVACAEHWQQWEDSDESPC
jgi:hypothetical protein